MVVRNARPAPTRGSKGSYTPPSYDAVQGRGQRGGSRKDPFLPDDVTLFTPKDGKNRVRILPPFWGTGAEAEFWSFHIEIHYGIGQDDTPYICPERQKAVPGHTKEKCSICAEASRLHNSGKQEEAKPFWPRPRRAMWVIDRADEDAGPKLWLCAKTLDENIADIASDEDNQEVLNLCDANEGYDVLFNREGSGVRTRYTGVSIARNASPLSEDPDLADAWVDFAAGAPIPDCLTIYPAAHIEKVFHGEVVDETESADEVLSSGGGAGRRAGGGSQRSDTRQSRGPSQDERSETRDTYIDESEDGNSEESSDADEEGDNTPPWGEDEGTSNKKAPSRASTVGQRLSRIKRGG